MADLAQYLLGQWGLPGAALVAMGWWTLRTQGKLESAITDREAATKSARDQADKEKLELLAKLEAEHAARLTDAQANTRAMLELSDQVHATVDRLADVAEQLSQSRRSTTPTRTT